MRFTFIGIVWRRRRIEERILCLAPFLIKLFNDLRKGRGRRRRDEDDTIHVAYSVHVVVENLLEYSSPVTLFSVPIVEWTSGRCIMRFILERKIEFDTNDCIEINFIWLKTQWHVSGTRKQCNWFSDDDDDDVCVCSCWKWVGEYRTDYNCRYLRRNESRRWNDAHLIFDIRLNAFSVRGVLAEWKKCGKHNTHPQVWIWIIFRTLRSEIQTIPWRLPW